jgi:diguanylate cyclase (GGDEF)-like protein/PAS domain S-box-containing protein
MLGAKGEALLEALHGIVADPETAQDVRLRRFIELGCRAIDAEFGLLIALGSNQNTEVLIATPQHAAESLDDGYLRHCRALIADGHADPGRAAAAQDPPAALAFASPAAVAVRVPVASPPPRVLCFGLPPGAHAPLALPEQRFLTLLAQWVGAELQHREQQAALQALSEWQRAILEGANVSIIATAPDGTILSFNRAAEKMLGYQAVEMVGKLTPAIIHDPDEVAARAAELSQELGRIIAPGFEVFVLRTRAGQAEEREWTYVRKNGSRLPVLLSVTALWAADGRIQGYLGIATDLTLRKQLEDAAAQARGNALSRSLIRSLAEGVIGMDSSAPHLIRFLNPAAERLFGLAEAEAIGLPIDRVVLVGADAERADAAAQTSFAQLLHEPRERETIEIDVQAPVTRRTFPVACAFSQVQESAAHGLTVLSFRDVSDRRANEERINFLARHDHLTGLPNRLALKDQMARALVQADRGGRRVAVLFIDLDRFKNINDSLGHHVGDQLLVEVAQRLRRAVRVSDGLARLGGDEFVVILENIEHHDDAAQAAGKIQAALEQAYVIGGRTLHAPPSIGISVYPDDGRDTESLMQYADAAMYEVKASGRNRWMFYTPRMNEEVQERLTLEEDLRLALKRGEFAVEYQPQWAQEGGRPFCWEALLRWDHPRRGRLLPERFLPIAEDAGLVVPIGEWLIQTACDEICRWERDGLGRFQLAVKLSGRQFREPALAQGLERLLATCGLAPQRLELEITETVLMADAVASSEVLSRLKSLGLRIAIDDFGTGYSSLPYLKSFPIDCIKIDRSFVRDIVSDPNNGAIVSAMISLARAIGVSIVAHGVESEAQRNFLRERDCHAIQGDLLGAPMSADAARVFLDRWRTVTV